MGEMEHDTVEDAVRDSELRGAGWGSAGGMEGADGRSEKTARAGASGWHDDFYGLGSCNTQNFHDFKIVKFDLIMHLFEHI
jgi:hypothetical protein